jgi:hypothetical protein
MGREKSLGSAELVEVHYALKEIGVSPRFI